VKRATENPICESSDYHFAQTSLNVLSPAPRARVVFDLPFMGLTPQALCYRPLRGLKRDGKQADLMIVKGNPAAKITDIENVEIVFKDGVGYDSEKLIQSVQGLVGIR
jgi:hypothetical protein